MTEYQKNLLAELGGFDNLELSKVKGSSNPALGAELAGIVGNPEFKAEITVNVSTRYYSQAVVGTPVNVLAAALPVAQQTQVPAFMFGTNDMQAGFSAGRNTIIPAGWNIADMKQIVVGQGEVDYNPLPHAAAGVDYAVGSIFFNQAQAGDLVLVIPMNGFVAGAAATTIAAEVIIHCNNVPYASLLNTINSDVFRINMIRYTVPVAQIAQLQNQITVVTQSIFGKVARDTIDPNTYITGGTFNPNIADMALRLLVNKYFGLYFPVNFDVVQLSWTITIEKLLRAGMSL